jgi:hypothetical protein
VEKITPITEELKQLGSSLGKFPAVNPYQVPAGYFDEFPTRMFSIVSGNALPAALAAVQIPYSVPAGYFDSLPETILNKIKSLSAGEQSLFPDQSSLPQQLSLPEQSSLAEQSPLPEQSSVDELAGLSSVLSGIDKKTPYTVPDNYFNELPGNIVSGSQAVEAANEELENLSPLMLSLKAVNVFTVPGGYFEELPGIILSKVSKAPVTNMKVVNGNFGRRIIKYAAAAAVIGLMITTGFFIVNRNSAKKEIVSVKGLEEKTAQTSDEDILNYLATQPVPVIDSLINSDREIKADAILDMLANVSDEELQQYLQLQTDTKILIN